MGEVPHNPARIRKHGVHVTRTMICRKFGTAATEALRTRNMIAAAQGTSPNRGASPNREPMPLMAGLNRANLSAGWYQIETMLAFKANRLVKVKPRHTPQTCSACDHAGPLSRQQKAFTCTAYRASFNAGHNTAINILHRLNTAVLGVEEGRRAAPCKASTFKMAA